MHPVAKAPRTVVGWRGAGALTVAAGFRTREHLVWAGQHIPGSDKAPEMEQALSSADVGMEIAEGGEEYENTVERVRRTTECLVQGR